MRVPYGLAHLLLVQPCWPESSYPSHTVEGGTWPGRGQVQAPPTIGLYANFAPPDSGQRTTIRFISDSSSGRMSIYKQWVGTLHDLATTKEVTGDSEQDETWTVVSYSGGV
jgi:hypothetical protein